MKNSKVKIRTTAESCCHKNESASRIPISTVLNCFGGSQRSSAGLSATCVNIAGRANSTGGGGLLRCSTSLWLLLLFSCSPLSTAFAQDSAFAYQGRLSDGGQPANGTYDLEFTVYDAASNGSVAGGPQTNLAVTINDGLFTTALDFGSNLFDGTTYWLEIGVRTNGSGGSFVTLNPRQELLPTPNALFARRGSLRSATRVR